MDYVIYAIPMLVGVLIYPFMEKWPGQLTTELCCAAFLASFLVVGICFAHRNKKSRWMLLWSIPAGLFTGFSATGMTATVYSQFHTASAAFHWIFATLATQIFVAAAMPFAAHREYVTGPVAKKSVVIDRCTIATLITIAALLALMILGAFSQ